MSTRRVILGNLGGGVFGLRVSLPGHDVVTEGGDPDALSFDSGWTDIVKMIQVGVATRPADANLFMDVLFTDPGYVPFVEMRTRSGLRVYDDYNPPSLIGGVGAKILADRLQLPLHTAAYNVVYAVFKIPLPIVL